MNYEEHHLFLIHPCTSTTSWKALFEEDVKSEALSGRIAYLPTTGHVMTDPAGSKRLRDNSSINQKNR